MPQAVFTFLEEYDFSGKTVIQQCLHAGVLPKCCENTAIGAEVPGQGATGCFARVDDEHEVIHRPPPGRVFHNAFYRKDGAKKKVLLIIREDKAKLKQRMSTMEHPFGTIKWYEGAHYLLCKGKEKATAEIGLCYLAYNLKRAINMVGVKRLIEAIG